MEIEEKNSKDQKSDIVREIEVIYVPIDYTLFITQFPLRSKLDNQFDTFLQPAGCEFKPKQKKVVLNYDKTSKFTNIKEDLTQKSNRNQNEDNFIILDEQKNKRNQMEEDSDEAETQQARNRKNQQKLLENQNQIDEEDNNNYSVQYVSKVVNNKTTYFVSHFDKINNKIYMFPVDSYLQMRPLIKHDKFQTSSKGQQQDIKKLSKEIEREKNLLQKHPDKYLEQRLKNWKSFQQIYESEKSQKLKYQDLSKQQINALYTHDDQAEQTQKETEEQAQKQLKKNPLLKQKPQQITELQNCSKQTYINRMEGQPLVERKQQKKQPQQ